MRHSCALAKFTTIAILIAPLFSVEVFACTADRCEAKLNGAFSSIVDQKYTWMGTISDSAALDSKQQCFDKVKAIQMPALSDHSCDGCTYDQVKTAVKRTVSGMLDNGGELAYEPKVKSTEAAASSLSVVEKDIKTMLNAKCDVALKRNESSVGAGESSGVTPAHSSSSHKSLTPGVIAR